MIKWKWIEWAVIMLCGTYMVAALHTLIEDEVKAFIFNVAGLFFVGMLGSHVLEDDR